MHPGRDIVVIGASAGGVEALQKVTAALPSDFPGAVFIVLHLWADARSYMNLILQRNCPLLVRLPEDGEAVRPGTVCVAPPDFHLLLAPDRIRVLRGPRENHTRPAINPLFRTAAAAYGPRVTGVILTGMLDDGTAGLWAVKRCGGAAIVQDPDEALFAEMPRNAVENVEVDYCVPLSRIPSLITRLAREPVETSLAQVPEVVQINNAGVKMTVTDIDMDKVGNRSSLTCPECGGALWEITEGRMVQFRCHVGHGYTPLTLAEEQKLSVEQALWSALRALKESAALDQRLAERTGQAGLEKANAVHHRNAKEKMRQAQQLLGFLNSFGAHAAAPLDLPEHPLGPATPS
ncbi:MAG: two-component system, chemotaxis family, response regulator [Verrucomicrobiota bacterium]